ncbi:hypothetical protein BTO02_18030 [Paraburkholderia sp. SOS3]|nr:hypothetical protein BTO02_18030 [Paraburkholderia sp. SOS3]
MWLIYSHIGVSEKSALQSVPTSRSAGENTSSAPRQHRRDETQNESETTRYGLFPVLPAVGAHQPRDASLTFGATFRCTFY